MTDIITTATFIYEKKSPVVDRAFLSATKAVYFNLPMPSILRMYFS